MFISKVLPAMGMDWWIWYCIYECK